MKTIANIIHHITFPLELTDSSEDLSYYENGHGFWERCEYNSLGNIIYTETMFYKRGASDFENHC